MQKKTTTYGCLVEPYQRSGHETVQAGNLYSNFDQIGLPNPVFFAIMDYYS